MKKYTVRLNFFWDDEDDMMEFTIIVPDNVNPMEIEDALDKEHHFLCFDDEEDRYGIEGSNPETLIGYVCEKYGWTWAEHKFDIDMNFN